MADKKCYRCNQWHLKLVHVWDNMDDTEMLLCLDCITEIVEGRATNLISKSELLDAIKELCNG